MLKFNIITFLIFFSSFFFTLFPSPACRKNYTRRSQLALPLKITSHPSVALSLSTSASTHSPSAKSCGAP